MTKEEIKKKVLAYGDWEFWFDRPFGAFLMSCFKDGQTRKFMRKAGLDVEWPAILFQNGHWYKSEKVWNEFEEQIKKYDRAKVLEIVENCERYAEKGRKRVDEIISALDSSKIKLQALYEIFTEAVSYVWLAHGFEHLYHKILVNEVPKYMEGDIEKNIGDISYPTKKNAHYYFEEALRGEKSITEIIEKFAWIKARGGFDDGWSESELSVERIRLKSKPQDRAFVHPAIPEPLKDLAKVAKALVYLRTLRTDVLYELMWRARPALTEIAKSYGLSFQELRDYSVFDLLADKPEKYQYHNFTAVTYSSEFALFQGPILKTDAHQATSELKGSVAYKGKVSGIAKIVLVAHEIDKVQKGDILVAPTTAPSFIFGMERAAAFVTDEGGITSHAAIVAREMKKPCVIGTKIATKVLKDGDVVEVDADSGTIKRLD